MTRTMPFSYKDLMQPIRMAKILLADLRSTPLQSVSSNLNDSLPVDKSLFDIIPTMIERGQ
jgi:hypothetical protein